MVIVNVSDVLNISANHSGVRSVVVSEHIPHDIAVRLELDETVMVRDDDAGCSVLGKVTRVDRELNVVEVYYDKTKVFTSDNTPAAVMVEEKTAKPSKALGPYLFFGLLLALATLTLFMLNPLAYTAITYVGIFDDTSGMKSDFFSELSPQMYGAASVVFLTPLILVWLTRSHWEGRFSHTSGNVMTAFVTLTGLIAGFLVLVAAVAISTYFVPTTEVDFSPTSTDLTGFEDMLKNPFSVTSYSTITIIALGWIPIVVSLFLTHLSLKPRIEQLKKS